MATVVKELKIKEQINVGSFKIEVRKDLTAHIIKFDNGDLKVRYSVDGTKASYLTPPVPKEHAKVIWQKAQQQQ